MARVLHGIEKGIRIYSPNSDTSYVDLLFGSAAPGGDTGEQDAAPIGSLYQHTNGTLFQKKANIAATTDWVRFANLDDVANFAWRNEKVVAATGDAAPTTGSVIDLVANPFGDDDGTALVAASFVVGNHIIFGVGGTPKLMRVSVVSGDEITVVDAASALVDNNAFIVANYLPDSPGAQEAQAIVVYQNSAIVKIADFNWALADGINLTGSYTGTTNGTVAANDTVEAAIGKIDANQKDLTTLSGVAQGAVDNGSFTGSTIPDSQTTKAALQALETAYEETDANVDSLITLSGVAENSTDLGSFTGSTIANNQTVKAALQDLETAYEETDANVDSLITLSGVAENATDNGTFTGVSLADSQTNKQLFQRIEVLLEQMRGVQVTGITTAATVDSVPHASVKGVKWLIEAFEVATPANRKAFEVFALNNGTLVDETTYAKLKLGANFNLTLSVDISGADMRLRAASTSAGVTVTARRIEVVKSVL